MAGRPETTHAPLITTVFVRKEQKAKEKLFIYAVGNSENQIDPQEKTAEERRRCLICPKSPLRHHKAKPDKKRRIDVRGEPPCRRFSPSTPPYYWSTGRQQGIPGSSTPGSAGAAPAGLVAGVKKAKPLSDIKPLGNMGPQRLAPP